MRILAVLACVAACALQLAAGALPSSVDLRPQLTAWGLGPRPQGARGTCSIFTTCSAIECAAARQTGRPVRLSPEFLNWAASQAAGRPSDGNFFHNALAGFQQHGLCAEADMPYATAFEAGRAPPPAAVADASAFHAAVQPQLAVHWIVPWKPDRFGVDDEQMREIKRVLAAGYPVAAGSGHSRLLVGYTDDAAQPGGGIFLTMDSALNRFDQVPYEFVRKQVADVFWVEAIMKPDSPEARVQISGQFWQPRLDALRAGTLTANQKQCETTGRLANFDRAAAALRGEKAPGEFQGLLFNDSDVYKMIEGWSYLVAAEKDPTTRAALAASLETVIARVAAAQLPDGYINTYYTLKVGLPKRMTNEQWDHETYCIGHLIEAGVAHWQSTGSRTLLDTAVRAADYLHSVYDAGTYTVPTGHEELELALLRLASATGDQRHAALAQRLVELRGKPHTNADGSVNPPWGDYAQDHVPVVDQREAVGHAVRAAYLYCALADLAARGHTEYVPALHAIWKDIVERRIFITGGIGPSGHNEGFTVPFDIPIRGAYQETCASIGLCLWAERMFQLEGQGQYMEQFERTLYNAVLAGVSLDGAQFFYVNPMVSRGGDRRQDWFACACCPPNVLRFLGSLQRAVYGVRGRTVHVNLFMESKATLLVDGQPVEVEQTTNYPVDGHVLVTLRNTTSKPVTLAIRRNPGMPAEADGYRRFEVAPGQSTVQEWDIPMAARRAYSDPRVAASKGHVVIMRGPLVYAAEAVDNGGALDGVVLPPDSPIAEERTAEGVPVLTVQALKASRTADGVATAPCTLVLRPYFMWANRRPGAMQVWFPESVDALGPLPEPGVAASASFVGHGDGLPALTDHILPSSSADHDVPRFTFWPHKGVAGGAPAGVGAGSQASPRAGEEWVELRYEQPRTIGTMGVYWFDDTGRGECRLPGACLAEYLDGQAWRPFGTGAVGTAKDTMNRLSGTPVTTSAVRLRVTLPPGMSAGILEWETRP